MDIELDRLASALHAEDPTGCGPGWATFYERACPLLVSWMSLHLYGNLRERLDPADLAQEAWLRAIESMRHFDPQRGAFMQWLAGIARNVLRGALAAISQSREPSGGTSNLARIEGLAESITSITKRISRDDVVAEFVEYTRSLDQADQTLLITCALESQPISEAAQRLGLSVEAASKRWQRLRARLSEVESVARLLGDRDA